MDVFAADLLDLYFSVLNEGDSVLQSLSLLGLSYFAGIRLESAEFERIAMILLNLISSENLADNVVQDMGKFLNTAAKTNSSWITEKILPQLFNLIHGGLTALKSEFQHFYCYVCNTDKSKRAIDVLCSLPALPDISSALLPQLFELLDSVKDTEVTSGVIRMIGRFCPKGELDSFSRLHSWAVYSVAENQTATIVRAMCPILREMSSSFSPE